MPSETDTATEDRILEAAHRVFVRRGTAGARTQEIADEAGVNKALLHYYFRTKEKLAEAVFVRAARSLFPNILRTLASDQPLPEKLDAVIDAELDMLAANPFLPGYVVAEMQYRPDRLRGLVGQVIPIEQMRGAVLETLQRQLDAEAEAGRLRPIRAEDLIVRLMALLVFPYAAAPMLEVLLGLDASDREALHERHRQELRRFVLNGLRP